MAFERNPDKVHIPAEVRVMWPNGPSRRWSKVRCSEASMPYGENGEFVGSYVCQACGGTSVAVQRVKSGERAALSWLCGECRNLAKPKKETANGI